MPKDQGMWNAIFAIAFLVVFALVYWGLTDGLDYTRWISQITVFDLSILMLATFRVVRLVSYDKIFQFVRDWFLDRSESQATTASTAAVCSTCQVSLDAAMRKPVGGPRRTVAELLECLWCTGLWAALATIAIYFSTSIGKLFVIMLAIAAVGSFLQNFSKMIARLGA